MGYPTLFTIRQIPSKFLHKAAELLTALALSARRPLPFSSFTTTVTIVTIAHSQLDFVFPQPQINITEWRPGTALKVLLGSRGKWGQERSYPS
jgi:hypothetical protein